MQRFLEFVSNHPVLWALMAVLIVTAIVVELRTRARGTINLGTFEFTRELNRGDAMLIDLRPGADFDKGHIRGARHLTPSQVDPTAKDLLKFKDSTVLVYCQAGMTSVDVAGRLLKAGYAKVYSLKGGIGAWVQDQLPLERGKGR